MIRRDFVGWFDIGAGVPPRPGRCSMPSATAASGHEDQFAPPRLSGSSAFSEETSAGSCGNEKDAPGATILRVANNEEHGIIRETLVSRTMGDLVAGSGLRLEGSVRRAVCPKLADPRPQPSIDVRHEALTCYLRTLVVAIGLTRRQRNLDGVKVVVRDSRQQMSDAVEPGLFLVV